MSNYIILVTGSRDWGDYATILEALASYEGQPDVIVRHGACSHIDERTGEELSADMLADRAARELGFEVDPMPADWKKHRKAAGYLRNAEMVKKDPIPNVCLAFGMKCRRYGGNCTVVPGRHISHGTRHCATIAEKAGIEVKRYKRGF
jgi:hypothetical protein